MMHEWPLIIFTTLIQVSIGSYLLTMCYVFNSKEQSHSLIPTMASLALGGLGLLSSIFHLGNPWHMFNTMNNVFSSWMSREVLFVGAYVGLLSLNVFIYWLRKQFYPLLQALTAGIGILTVFVMSNIYVNSLFVLWATWNTYSAFWATALMTGSLMSLLAFSLTPHSPDKTEMMKKVTSLFITFAGIAFILTIFNFIYVERHLTENLTRAITARYADTDFVEKLLSFRIMLLVFVFGILHYVKKLEGKRTTLPLIIACLISIMAELIGRLGFFSLSI